MLARGNSPCQSGVLVCLTGISPCQSGVLVRVGQGIGPNEPGGISPCQSGVLVRVSQGY